MHHQAGVHFDDTANRWQWTLYCQQRCT